MNNVTEMKNLLYASGSALPTGIEYYAVFDCYSSLEKFALSMDEHVKCLRRYFTGGDIGLFLRLMHEINTTLCACYFPMLSSDCVHLIQQTENGKKETCEALLERFCANLTSLAVTFQTNHFRLEDKSSSVVSKPANTDPGIKPLILAVDDSPEILRTLQAILYGRYRFFGVSSGFSALKILVQHKPDLFILDIDMPNMNGFELAQKAHMKDSGTPLVFLTSNANRDNLITALKVGAADFMVKPCDKKIILEKVKKLLGK